MIGKDDTQILWQDYLAVIIRRRWWFILPCVLIVAAAMTTGMVLPKVYRAEAAVLVETPEIMNPLISGVAIATNVEQRMRTIVDQLLGWTSLSRLVHKLGLDKDVHNPGELESLIGKIQKNLHVVFAGHGSLIKISYDGAEPRLTQQVVNTITEVYLERNMESQHDEAQAAITFIGSELDVYRKKLEESELKLREFRELHTMDMPVAMQLNDQLINLEVTLAQLLVENTEEHPTVIQVKRQIEELKRRRNEEIKRVIVAAMAKGQNPEIYADMAAMLDASAPAPSPDPKLRSAKEAYQMWVERLDSAAVQVVRPSAAPGGGVEATAVAASPGAPAPGPGFAAAPPPRVASDARMVSLTLGPRQEQEMARLERDTEINRKTYLDMKQRLEQARITQRLGKSDEGTKFKVVEPARLPLAPVFPNLWLFFFGSLLVGILVGTTAVFAGEYLDDSFVTADDLQAVLGVPVLGSISTILTTDDVAAKRRRMRGWVSPETQLKRVNRRLLHPAWQRLDHVLSRWGL